MVGPARASVDGALGEVARASHVASAQEDDEGRDEELLAQLRDALGRAVEEAALSPPPELARFAANRVLDLREGHAPHLGASSPDDVEGMGGGDGHGALVDAITDAVAEAVGRPLAEVLETAVPQAIEHAVERAVAESVERVAIALLAPVGAAVEAAAAEAVARALDDQLDDVRRAVVAMARETMRRPAADAELLAALDAIRTSVDEVSRR